MDQTMRLKALYFPGKSDTGLPYRKALVYIEDVPYFADLGGTTEQPIEQSEEEEEEETVNPDKGFGAPGSLKWHFAHINTFETPEDVFTYVASVVGHKVDKEINIKQPFKRVQLKAAQLIKEFLNNDKGK